MGRKTKVISNLCGGLGNQMFMYAAARSLAIRTNSDLILDVDTGFFSDRFERHFELDNFNIKVNKASRLDNFNYFGGSYIRSLSFFLKKHLPLFRIKIIEEENFAFNSLLLSPKKQSVSLIGYWQTEKYFYDCADIIRKDFEITANIPESVKKEAEKIESFGRRAVALGVRRYQEVKVFKNVKLTEKDYYYKAMSLMAENIEDPVFFCFSQDQKWAQKNLSKEFNIIYIESKDHRHGAIEDLYLLKKCRHFVISNSTFYWWGAWLSDNKDKVVICPDNWVNKLSPCFSWIILETKKV